MSTPEDYQKSVKGYYRLITGVDEVVGRIREVLERRGLFENTVVIYTADNGFFLGERELSGKWLMHEESIRTPLIIRDPRIPAARRGKRRGDMTLNIDVAPSILRLAGIDAPQSMQGRDLTPPLRGEAARWRQEFDNSHLPHSKAVPYSEMIPTQLSKYFPHFPSLPFFLDLSDFPQY